MKTLEKLNYKNVVKSISVINVGDGGYEYIANDYCNPGKFDFDTKSTYDRDDKKEVRAANKELSKWKKGLRKLIKKAKIGPGAMNLMASAYTGNGPTNNSEYFWKLYNALSSSDIIRYGVGDEILMSEHYVNGSIEVWFE